MTSQYIDLAHNATCQLYRRFGERELIFRHVDPKSLLDQTPMKDLWGSIVNSTHKIVQLSDAMRLALIYKYGGWYSDLDMIFITSLPEMFNVVSSDQLTQHELATLPNSTLGKMLSNAIFHFEQNHPFLSAAMLEFKLGFSAQNRISGGPITFTRAIKRICEFDSQILDNKLMNMKQCQGVLLLPQIVFYPAGYMDHPLLVSHFRSRENWQIFFNKSVSVHLYASSTRNVRVKQRKFYGKEVPALLHLATDNCPISLGSQRFI